MKAFTIIDAMQELAKSTNKPCMFIGSWEWYDGDLTDVIYAAPYLDLERDMQLLSDGQGILVFDSEEEMERYYKMTVGDDGPTESNSYDGPARVYAVTCSRVGELLSENT